MNIFGKPKPTTSSAFSEFIRNASSAEKKKVYTIVLRKATERQLRLIKAAEQQSQARNTPAA